ncbi:MAG: glutathione S-transferase family protein [Deltaproteobacteria bacterium]|nr:glutathione S-transferase family protein [Deltaproteobacteria bacterium]
MADHQLITIVWSHYNEQVRWVLQRYGVEWREHAYLPVFHFLPVMWETLGRGVGHADKVSSRFSTPLLITDEGRRISDSREIMKYLSDRFAEKKNHLYPTAEVTQLQNYFHDHLGPATRKIVYYMLLPSPEINQEMVKKLVSLPQQWMFKFLGSIMTNMITQNLHINEKTVQKSLQKVRQIFSEISERIQSRKYLVGRKISAADISFACLASPVLWIDQSEGHSTIPVLDSKFPKEFIDLKEELRATPAGQFALRLFKEEHQTIKA